MRALCLVLLLALPGCFRLSDPYYLPFKPLTADAPLGPEYSLLLGSIEVEGGFFSAGSIDSVYFPPSPCFRASTSSGASRTPGGSSPCASR